MIELSYSEAVLYIDTYLHGNAYIYYDTINTRSGWWLLGEYQGLQNTTFIPIEEDTVKRLYKEHRVSNLFIDHPSHGRCKGCL